MPVPQPHLDGPAPAPTVPARGSAPTQALQVVTDRTEVIPTVDSLFPAAPGGTAADLVPTPRTGPYAAAWAEPPGPPIAPARHREALRTTGLILLGATLGWWLFFLVRLVWWLVQVGPTDTIIFSTIDAVPEETVVAAILSVITAGTLTLAWARDRRGAALAGIAGLLSLVTLGVTVWRLL